MVDGLNRVADAKAVEATYAGTRKVYQATGARNKLVLAAAEDAPDLAPWLIEALKKR
jgi:hypothetical protein